MLHHARRAARAARDGSLVPLEGQDRGLWDTGAIAEGIGILRAAPTGCRSSSGTTSSYACPPTAPSSGSTVRWPSALAALDASLPRHTAVAAYLHERDGDLATAARLYAEAARQAPNLAERDHLTRQAARLNARRCR